MAITGSRTLAHTSRNRSIPATGWFRRLTCGRKHRAEDQIVSAAPGLGCHRFVRGVHRTAYDKPLRNYRTQTARRHALCTQVHAVSASGQGDVRPLVHHHQGSRPVDFSEYPADQTEQRAVGHLTFPDLNQICASGGGANDEPHEVARVLALGAADLYPA